MDILNSIISQIKNPFQYTLIGTCWFVFEFYNFPASLLYPSIIITSGVAYSLSKLFSWLWKRIIEFIKRKQQRKQNEKERVELLVYLSTDATKLEQLNKLMNMNSLGYKNHKYIDNNDQNCVNCVFFIRDVNAHTFMQNRQQWFREDFDQIMKKSYIWIDPIFMEICEKAAKGKRK